MGTKGLTALEPTTNKYKYTEMYTHSRTVPVSSMFILKLKPYKLDANRSFRQRVTSPTTSSPTYEVDSPKSKLCQATFTLTRISIIPRSFIHCRAKQTTKYVYPELEFLSIIEKSRPNAKSKYHTSPKQGTNPGEQILARRITQSMIRTLAVRYRWNILSMVR